MKKPELLAPAGDLEKLEAAFLYGADAAYLSGPAFGMRAKSANFSEDELTAALSLARRLGKKIHITVNTMPHNDEVDALPRYLSFLDELRPDALLVSDLGVFSLAQKYASHLPLHISTQANTVNWAAAAAWQQLGATRIVLARELSLAELCAIRDKVEIELEIFAHGAMCIAYSGRCLLSAYLAGRDANRGQCAQACRWRYRLEEETRSGEFFPITEDERGTYIFNSRDLSLLAALPELFPLGLDSLKIEGRMKSLHYVATVTSVYRQAIDSYFAAPESFTVRESWLAELAKISHRPYTEGFLHGNPGAAGQIYTAASYTQTHEFVGVVREARDGFLLIEQRGAVALGDRLEILQPGGALVFCPVTAMFDTDGAPIERAPHPKELFRVPYAHALSPLSLVRRAKNGA